MQSSDPRHAASGACFLLQNNHIHFILTIPCPNPPAFLFFFLFSAARIIIMGYYPARLATGTCSRGTCEWWEKEDGRKVKKAVNWGDTEAPSIFWILDLHENKLPYIHLKSLKMIREKWVTNSAGSSARFPLFPMCAQSLWMKQAGVWNLGLISVTLGLWASLCSGWNIAPRIFAELHSLRFPRLQSWLTDCSSRRGGLPPLSQRARQLVSADAVADVRWTSQGNAESDSVSVSTVINAHKKSVWAEQRGLRGEVKLLWTG